MRPRASDIQRTVASYFNVSLDQMLGGSHEPFYAHPRQTAVYIARKALGYSYPRLGVMFNRDYTTMIYAVRAVEKRMADDAGYELDVLTLLAATNRAVEKRETASDTRVKEAA